MAILRYLPIIGIALIFLGMIILFTSSIYSSNQKTNVKSAGIIFVGPFPLGWASDKKMFYLLLILTIIVMIISYFLRKF